MAQRAISTTQHHRVPPGKTGKVCAMHTHELKYGTSQELFNEKSLQMLLGVVQREVK